MTFTIMFQFIEHGWFVDLISGWRHLHYSLLNLNMITRELRNKIGEE